MSNYTSLYRALLIWLIIMYLPLFFVICLVLAGAFTSWAEPVGTIGKLVIVVSYHVVIGSVGVLLARAQRKDGESKG